MPLNLESARRLIQDFDFKRLFVDELGWSHSRAPKPVTAAIGHKGDPTRYTRTPIAELSGVVVFEIATTEGVIPDAKIRAAIHADVSKLIHENLLVFVDSLRTQSLWYWVKRDGNKTFPRDHLYVKGQPGDLFLSKLAALVFELSEFEAIEGDLPVITIVGRLQKALDVEKVTKLFFKEFDVQRLDFTRLISGIEDERARQWYASALVNRLMFIWFLQARAFLDTGDREYLLRKLQESKARGADRFYHEFLRSLFFEGFAKPTGARDARTNKLLGRIHYLNGGLFLPHKVETDHGYAPDAKPAAIRIRIPDRAFENLFGLFARFSWYLDDRPGQADNEINPDVLGYIFEKYINQKEFGAYYTRPEITEYLCEQTIHELVLEKLGAEGSSHSLPEVLLRLKPPAAKKLLMEILPGLTLLDPACGSGAFLVAALRTLLNLYSAVVGRIEALGDPELSRWLAGVRKEHPSIAYFLKKRIITDNLYGVDLMEEATEIAKLRLFLALVASAHSEDQLEPLPNIDFNILAGNSLIGLLSVDAKAFDRTQTATGGATADFGQGRFKLEHKGELGFVVETKVALTQKEKVAAFVAQKTASRYAAILEDKNKSIELYKKHAFAPGRNGGGGPVDPGDLVDQDERLLRLREHIDKLRSESYAELNKLLLDQFLALGIQFQEATWDDRKNEDGKPVKRTLKIADIECLHPFHWGYEFDQVFARGGFDAIITNPPWEIFKPQAKEFFSEHSDLVTKNKMTIKEFEKEQARLLKDPEIRTAWLAFRSRFPHVNLWFRNAPQYKSQLAWVDGKKATTDLNLYKLFLEQSFHLLRVDGRCGIVIPSGIYTDLGAKQLREMLFSQTRIKGLFGFENRKEIFENVDSRFKFVVLTFEKGGETKEFPAAFMRHDVAELLEFPQRQAIAVRVELVRQVSPESLSVPEFRNERDLVIAKKLNSFPTLGTELPAKWQLILQREFHVSDDEPLFKAAPANGRLPLVEGKMFYQYDHAFSQPRFWVNVKEARVALASPRLKFLQKTAHELGISVDINPDKLLLDYEAYRIAFRDIAASTNERTMIACILPPALFCQDTVKLEVVYRDVIREVNGKKTVEMNVSGLTYAEKLFLLGILNSFTADFQLRQKVTNHLSQYFVYNLPVPRLICDDPGFWPVVWRVARLVCTTHEFDPLRERIRIELRKHKIQPPLESFDRNGLVPAKDATSRARLRAELDGLVAHLYGLTEQEFAHILSTFPLVSEPIKLMARNAYRDVQLGLIT